MQYLKKKILKFYRSKIIDWETEGRITPNKKKINLFEEKKIKFFGKQNPKKIFYIIRVEPGGGFFSILFSVLINLELCSKKKYIPFIDLENFHTKYNQKNMIDNTFNSWEYYFHKISNYNLNNIYKSKNVYFSKKKIDTRKHIKKNEFDKYKKIIGKYIKVKDSINKVVKKFEKQKFKNKKVIGLHFRGTDMKTTPSHPFPPTYSQISLLLDSLLTKKKYESIFIITEQASYLEKLRKKYGKKLLYFNSFRSNQSKIFSYKGRKNHRYLLGRDILIETILLSKTDIIISSKTNVSKMALLLSRKKKKTIHIDNGNNTSKFLLSHILWFLKRIMPEALGGFKKNIKYSLYN